MNDTPRTDAAWNEGFDPVILSAAQLARRLRQQCEELEHQNAALKIKCNKLRLALEDIEQASVDPWAKIAADRVLKEAQP